mmetsp:Transcript_21502/g.36286  ORF Transcript_21502/g.36286 Transcript_21502/m.36286 type:complete len:220 (-) Transcript_21502:124-783(-)
MVANPYACARTTGFNPPCIPRNRMHTTAEPAPIDPRMATNGAIIRSKSETSEDASIKSFSPCPKIADGRDTSSTPVRPTATAAVSMYPKGSLRNILENNEAQTGAENTMAEASPIGIFVNANVADENPTNPQMHRNKITALWCVWGIGDSPERQTMIARTIHRTVPEINMISNDPMSRPAIADRKVVTLKIKPAPAMRSRPPRNRASASCFSASCFSAS